MPFNTNHIALKYLTDFDYIKNDSGPGLPLLIFFFAIFLYMAILRNIKMPEKKLGHCHGHTNEKEGFAPYFENLNQEDLKWTITEQEYSEQKFGYKSMLDSVFKAYKDSKSLGNHEKKTI